MTNLKKEMKNAILQSVVMALIVGFAGIQAGANETALDLSISKSQKSELIANMEQQLKRHESMDKEEIVKDLIANIEANWVRFLANLSNRSSRH